jgi:predicted transcriptional regulator
MPPGHEIVHKALASEARRQILLSLKDKPKYLSEISKEIKKNPQTIDFHLRLLEEIGIIESEWEKGKKYYKIKDKKILDFISKGLPIPPHHRPKPPHEIMNEMWEDMKKRLDKIEKRLEDMEKKL